VWLLVVQRHTATNYHLPAKLSVKLTEGKMQAPVAHYISVIRNILWSTGTSQRGMDDISSTLVGWSHWVHNNVSGNMRGAAGVVLV